MELVVLTSGPSEWGVSLSSGAGWLACWAAAGGDSREKNGALSWRRQRAPLFITVVSPLCAARSGVVFFRPAFSPPRLESGRPRPLALSTAKCQASADQGQCREEGKKKTTLADVLRRFSGPGKARTLSTGSCACAGASFANTAVVSQRRKSVAVVTGRPNSTVTSGEYTSTTGRRRQAQCERRGREKSENTLDSQGHEKENHTGNDLVRRLLLSSVRSRKRGVATSGTEGGN